MSVFRSNLFKNCVAIVTGGGTGIGRAISYELIHLGAKVVIASRNEDKLKKATQELSKIKSDGEVTHITCNIRKEDEVKSLIQKTLEKYGKLDFVVNNGGGQFMSNAADISLKGWNAVIETNLTGTFLVSREAYNQWFRENGGSIVNIIADMWTGFPMMCHTGAARAAVDNMTKTLSLEWASSGVRVNSVAPGFIESPTAAANYAEGIFDHLRTAIPGNRTGEPDEISGAVCFLLSPAASFITGACLNVDCAGSLYKKHFYDVGVHDKLPAYKWIPDPPTGKSKL